MNSKTYIKQPRQPISKGDLPSAFQKLQVHIFKKGTKPLSSIEGAKVEIQYCSTLTNAMGKFLLKISKRINDLNRK